MARSFAGGTDKVDWGNLAALDGLTKLTVSSWVYVATGCATFAYALSKSHESGIIAGWALFPGNPNTNAWVFARNNDTSFGESAGAITLDTWQHWLYHFDGTQPTNATRLRLWINGTERTLTYTGTVPASIGAVTDAVLFSGAPNGSPFTGRLAEVGAWGGVAIADAAIISALANGYSPAFFKSLAASGSFFHVDAIRDLQDRGGLAAAPTITGTTVVEHPRMLYPSARHVRRTGGVPAVGDLFLYAVPSDAANADIRLGNPTVHADAGPITTPQAVADSVAFTESLLRQSAKALAETVGLTETLARVVTRAAITETLSLTEALHPQTQKLIAETVLLTEAQARQAQKRLAETLGLTETLTRELRRGMAEAVSLAEAQARQAQLARAEAVSLAEALTVHRTAAVAIAETVSLGETLTREVRRVAGLAETIATTEALARTIQRAIVETVTLTEAEARQAGVPFAESVALTEALARRVTRPIAEAVSLGEALAVAKVAIVNLGETVGLTEAQARQVQKATAETVSLAESTVRLMARVTEEVVGLTEAQAREVRKGLAESVAFVEGFSTRVVKLVTLPGETVTLTEAESRQAGKAVLETVGLTEARLVQIAKQVAETLVLTEALHLRVGWVRGEVLGLTETLAAERLAAAATLGPMLVTTAGELVADRTATATPLVRGTTHPGDRTTARADAARGTTATGPSRTVSLTHG